MCTVKITKNTVTRGNIPSKIKSDEFRPSLHPGLCAARRPWAGGYRLSRPCSAAKFAGRSDFMTACRPLVAPPPARARCCCCPCV